MKLRTLSPTIGMKETFSASVHESKMKCARVRGKCLCQAHSSPSLRSSSDRRKGGLVAEHVRTF